MQGRRFAGIDSGGVTGHLTELTVAIETYLGWPNSWLETDDLAVSRLLQKQ